MVDQRQRRPKGSLEHKLASAVGLGTLPRDLENEEWAKGVLTVGSTAIVTTRQRGSTIVASFF
jgi:hypothetical protein